MAYKEEPLVIYWAPRSVSEAEDIGEWNMLYEEPVTLFSDLIQTKSAESKDTSFFSCPAVSARLKRTFVFRNNLKTVVNFDGSDPLNVLLEPEEGIHCSVARTSGLTTGASLEFRLQYFLFAEEPVTCMVNPPYFHRPTYTKTGTIIASAFDFGKWYRPFVVEVQTWDKQGTITLEDGEPLFYFEPLTDRKVIFKRYTMTPKLMSYAIACADAGKYYGRHKPLVDRYRRFMSTRTNEVVLREIKNNLV
jgi:hypothetical protein